MKRIELIADIPNQVIIQRSSPFFKPSVKMVNGNKLETILAFVPTTIIWKLHN